MRLGSWVWRPDTNTPRFLGVDCAASGHRVKAAFGVASRWLRQPWPGTRSPWFRAY